MLRIRLLVPKIGSRRSDGPISRFSFCGENAGRSFVACSHDPIFRTDKESLIWRQTITGISCKYLSASFIFQEECQMKIKHVLFLSIFSNLRMCVGRSFSMCSNDPIFGTNKNRILKNGSSEQAKHPFFTITCFLLKLYITFKIDLKKALRKVRTRL